MNSDRIIETDIFARLDRLPFTRFHVLVIVALGVSWILDGLEVTLAGAVSTALMHGEGFRLTAIQVGAAGSAYVTGAVLGALIFGWLTDRLGRRKLFFITLALYLTATAATAFSWSFLSFALFRFLTGAGIGGEYSAINSAIQELIPARLRGRSDLIINGSFWIGGAIGAGGAIILLDPAIVDPVLGWRLAFLIGAALGLIILCMRFWLPESPRWLMIHGRAQEAEAIVTLIETQLRERGFSLPAPQGRARFHARRFTPLREILRSLFVEYRERALVGLCLMAAQAFFYNAIFFTYALVLANFYGIPPQSIGWYILPFALGNVLGPVILGRFFDSWGRKPMILLTFVASGICLLVAGALFKAGVLTATTQTLLWSITFFFASSAASASYLTISETFPLEIRALAIAAFYALGTGLGGIAGPWLFGLLIDTGNRDSLFTGYALAAALMIVAGLVHWRFGIAAERKPLEDVARPLSFLD